MVESTASTGASAGAAELPAYTLAEVGRHNTAGDAWIVIGGRVLDVTAYLQEHPGGPEPLLDCLGTDATQDFEDAAHSSDALNLFNKYAVGTLAKPNTVTNGALAVPGADDAKPRSDSTTSSVRSFLARHGILEIAADVNANDAGEKDREQVEGGGGGGRGPIFTAAEVARHNRPEDAWIAVGGRVLDITAYLDEHPGGPEPILDVLGTVATQDFDDAAHSSDAHNMLQQYTVGYLAGAGDTAKGADSERPRAKSRGGSEPRPLYTRAEVAQHRTPTDGWVIIGNQVCDVTKYMNKHPGGRTAFVDRLGADCTAHFEQAGHSNYANKLVKEYCVGKLAPQERSGVCALQ